MGLRVLLKITFTYYGMSVFKTVFDSKRREVYDTFEIDLLPERIKNTHLFDALRKNTH